MVLAVDQQMHLVGDSQPWVPPPWRAVDDTVHGGLSFSFLDVKRFDSDFSNQQATFFGVLDCSRFPAPPPPPPPGPRPSKNSKPAQDQHQDTSTTQPPLPAWYASYYSGAFASQRTTTLDAWTDLTAWDGLFLSVAQTDGQTYTIALRDEFSLLDPASFFSYDSSNSSGFEFDTSVLDAAEAGLRYEANFTLPPTDLGGRVRLPWDAFAPMRGGRPVEGARGLDRSRITELSLMVRSYFNHQQQGNFSLTLDSIAVYKLEMEDGVLPRGLASLARRAMGWFRAAML